MKGDPMQLRFVLLHHGYHGTSNDFKYLTSIAENALRQQEHEQKEDQQRYVFIHPHGSDLLRTEEGVWVCARRYVEHACAIVAAELAKLPSVEAEGAAASSTDGSQTRRKHLEVHLDAVAHSMGGLILRAAFPEFMQRLERMLMDVPYTVRVAYDTFCTLATPHLGVRYMRSPVLTFLGGHVGHRISTALADLFTKNSLLSGDLVTEESLAVWARFKRRVLLNVVNDGTVLVNSSSFILPLSARQRIGVVVAPASSATQTATTTATSPDEPVAAADHDGADTEMSAAEAARGPSHDEEGPGTAEGEAASADVPNPDASVVHLACYGVQCASTVEGLRRNAFTLNKISVDLWPPELMPEQRALAEHILSRVAPLELHMVDFRPLRDAPTHELPAAVAEARRRASTMMNCMVFLGAHRFSHAALMCKRPFNYPAFFGFVSEFIVSDLLHIHLTPDAVADVVRQSAVTAGLTDGGGIEKADAGAAETMKLS